jgi:hypothetical protein
MRKLVRRIKKERQPAKHCAVYKDELNRVWPFDGKRRESEIGRFAQDHGWRLRYYHDVFAQFLTKSPEHVAIALQRSIFSEGQISHGRVL